MLVILLAFQFLVPFALMTLYAFTSPWPRVRGMRLFRLFGFLVLFQSIIGVPIWYWTTKTGHSTPMSVIALLVFGIFGAILGWYFGKPRA